MRFSGGFGNRGLGTTAAARLVPVATCATGRFVTDVSGGTPSKKNASHSCRFVELHPVASRTPQKTAARAGINRRLNFTPFFSRLTGAGWLLDLLQQFYFMCPKPKMLTM
jgi:hypothetical protein